MVGSFWKVSVYYTTELLNSYFHLCECGYHHDRVDADALIASIANVDEDLVALYLGYYDWGSSHLVVGVSDLDIPPFLYIYFIYGLCRMWHVFCVVILDIINILIKL
jgi:hypothetical protein